MIDEPNVILPLATSYNERGVDGFTHVVTNAEDQRKINSFYELSKNPMTGKGTLTLSKRPGVTAFNSIGASAQTSYLIAIAKGGSIIGNPVVFSTVNSGINLVSSIIGQNTTLVSSTAGASYVPAFIDKFNQSQSEYLLLQTRVDALTGQRVFYSNDASNVAWNEISDADFIGLVQRGKMEPMDGYIFTLDHVNLIYNCDLNNIASWTASNFLAKQIKQDFPRGLARLKNQILAFGDETVEMFYNAGNTTGSPLGRIPQLHQRIGLVPSPSGGTHYYATIEDKIYFVGRRGGGLYSVGVFVYDGYNFEKVSTPYIDKILNLEASAIYGVFTVGFNGQVAVAVSWSIPSTSPQKWLMFFPDWKEWFEWTSDTFSPTNCGPFFLGVVSGHTDRVYNFTASDNWQDTSSSYQWLTQFRLPSNGSNLHRMVMYGVDADTDTSANTISVDASDDDCASFYSLQSLDLTRERKVNFRGGSYRKRHIRLSATDARPKRIHNFLARIE